MSSGAAPPESPGAPRGRPVLPYGMPVLPLLTIHRRSTNRANGMCVCPEHTTLTESGTPFNTSAHRDGRVSTSTTSLSSRGLPWQNSTSPTPSRCTINGCSSAANSSTWTSDSWAAAHEQTAGVPSGSRPPRAAVTRSRSALPRTRRTRSPRPMRRSSTSVGCGPAARSPVTTTRPADCTSGSASTASRQGRTP